MKPQIRFYLRSILFALVAFSLMRWVLLLSNGDYFAALTWVEVFIGFAHGIRFDASIVVALFLLPILLTFLPGKWFGHIRWFHFVGWLLFVILALAILSLAMDIVFFREVQRHVGTELISIQSDLGFLLSMIGLYWYLFVGYLMTMGLMAWAWQRWVLVGQTPIRLSWLHQLWLLPLTLFLAVLIVRGGLVTGKPLSPVNAFISSSIPLANLSLNGVYTGIRLSQDVGQSRMTNHHHFDDEEIVQTLGIPARYPFAQQPQPLPHGDQLPNIFVLQIESLNHQFIDALGGQNYGVTPFLDSLVDHSLVFNRFYANGQRSIIGLQSTWLGVPALPGLPTINNGLSASRLSQIAHLAKQAGYQTLFAQSSKRSSFHVDSLSRTVGFEQYWGMEDIEDHLIMDYPPGIKPKFGYDYEILHLLQQQVLKVKQAQPDQPVLMGFFSGTTHTPYIRFPAFLEKYPPQQEHEGMGGMLNSIAYLDHSLKTFFEALSTQPWFDNSIFLITADHTKGIYLPKNADIPSRFHIPLIIYSPGKQWVQPGVVDRVHTQLDIMPTLAQWMNIQTPVSSLGSSLLAPAQYPNLINAGYVMYSLTDEGYISTDLQRVITTNLSTDKAAALLKQVQMVDQRIAQSLQANEWAK